MRRRVEGRRLAYYGAVADAGLWDDLWSGLSEDWYKDAERGRLGPFEIPFTRYLPRSGRILEAGCGVGQHVLALRVRGYDCEGIDWAEQTVARVRSVRSDVPIRAGDVTRLPARDGSYDGYISLGVVEHRQAGPQPFLREAYRVLSDRGVMLVSVPYFHPLRKLKARCGLYRARVDGLPFYQYAFTTSEFIGILQQSGFAVVDTFVYGALKGLGDELWLLRQIVSWRWLGWRVRDRLRSWGWAERHLGHMVMFVCRKQAISRLAQAQAV